MLESWLLSSRPRHVALILFASAAPSWQQAEWCFSHGFNLKICCGEGTPPDGCFAEELFITRDLCCGTSASYHDSNVSAKRIAVPLFIRLAKMLWVVADCLVQGRDSDCEHVFLDTLAFVNPSKDWEFPRWLGSEWAPRQAARGIDHGRELRLALMITEAPMLWRAVALADAYNWYSWRLFIKKNVEASRHLHALIAHSTAQRWVQGVGSSFQSWSEGGSISYQRAADEVVHVAMIASAGKPTFGSKAMAGVRSALFFAKRLPVRFHFFVDEDGEADVRQALDRVEPWLTSKGEYVFYGESVLQKFFILLRSRFPLECLGTTSHFGDVGFLRLFVHEVMADTDVELLIFVDAGDYVFLEDPAEMLKHRADFEEGHVAGGASGEPLPLQLFDLPRMRRSNWSERVVYWANRLWYEEGPEQKGWADACKLGEGYFMRVMGGFKDLWYDFNPTWCFEPHEYWLAGEGWKNVWYSDDKSTSDAIWTGRVYPGVEDWTSIRVFCPHFIETWVYTVFALTIPPSTGEYAYSERLGMHRDKNNDVNSTLGEAYVYTDERSLSLRCNQKVLGIHFIAGLKGVPWVRKFLNYWTGNGAWGSDSKDYLKRSLLKAVAS